LKSASDNANAFRMRESPSTNLSCEERLAAKLRENLRRRKAQARAVAGTVSDSDRPQPLPNPPSEG
jgi:DNA repair photolyase